MLAALSARFPGESRKVRRIVPLVLTTSRPYGRHVVEGVFPMSHFVIVVQLMARTLETEMESVWRNSVTRLARRLVN